MGGCNLKAACHQFIKLGLFYPEAKGQLRDHPTLSLILKIPGNSLSNRDKSLNLHWLKNKKIIFGISNDLTAKKIMLVIWVTKRSQKIHATFLYTKTCFFQQSFTYPYQCAFWWFHQTNKMSIFSFVKAGNICCIRYADVSAENSVQVIYKDRPPNKYETPNTEVEHSEL